MTTETAKAKHPGAIDPWEVIYLFRDYLGHILLCVFITVGLAVLYLLYTRPVYSSRALLEISQQEKQNGGDIDSSDTLKTIELKIASQSVLLGVIKANKLADDPDFAPPRDAGPYSDSELVQRLASLVSVNLVRGSRLISVTAEDHSPEKAQRLAQAVINEFFKQSVDLRLKDSSSTREALLAEAKRLASEFTAAEEKLQSYREKFNTVSLTDKQNIVFERLKELNQQVANAKKTRMALESDYQRLKGYIDSDPEQLLNIRDLAALPEMVDLRKQVALQEAQVATLAQRYGPLHPTMVQSKSQLEELRKSLHNAIRKAGNLIMQSYDSAKSTEVALETSLSEQERASLELDRIAIPYHSLERQLESSSTMYQQILGRLKQTDLSQGLINANDINGAIIRVIEQPLVPMHPIRPSPKLVVAIAILGGLVIGCALALLSRAFDNTLTSVDEAESFLGLSVLTAIPRSSQDKLEGGAIVLTNPASAEAESFRSLRTSLSLLGKDEEKRSILFTSAISGEGKSYCSVNYATALAMQGHRTLLIDGDLRRPSMQRIFAARTGKPGLTDCLKYPGLFPAVVQETSVKNLFLLGDYYGKPGGAELLGQDGLADIIQRGLATYDRVVIDTAPLTAVSDTLYIAKHVSTICLVVYAGKTPRRLVKRVCKLLDEVAKHAATGVILNKVSRGRTSMHYYYSNTEAYA